MLVLRGVGAEVRLCASAWSVRSAWGEWVRTVDHHIPADVLYPFPHVSKSDHHGQ